MNLQSDSMLANARVIRGFEMGAANWEFERGLAEMRRGITTLRCDNCGRFLYFVAEVEPASNPRPRERRELVAALG